MLTSSQPESSSQDQSERVFETTREEIVREEGEFCEVREVIITKRIITKRFRRPAAGGEALGLANGEAKEEDGGENDGGGPGGQPSARGRGGGGQQVMVTEYAACPSQNAIQAAHRRAREPQDGGLAAAAVASCPAPHAAPHAASAGRGAIAMLAPAFRCTQCSRTLASAHALAQHCKDKHPQLRHACPACRKAFASADALQQHTASVHETRTGGAGAGAVSGGACSQTIDGASEEEAGLAAAVSKERDVERAEKEVREGKNGGREGKKRGREGERDGARERARARVGDTGGFKKEARERHRPGVEQAPRPPPPPLPTPAPSAAKDGSPAGNQGGDIVTEQQQYVGGVRVLLSGAARTGSTDEDCQSHPPSRMNVRVITSGDAGAAKVAHSCVGPVAAGSESSVVGMGSMVRPPVQNSTTLANGTSNIAGQGSGTNGFHAYMAAQCASAASCVDGAEVRLLESKAAGQDVICELTSVLEGIHPLLVDKGRGDQCSLPQLLSSLGRCCSSWLVSNQERSAAGHTGSRILSSKLRAWVVAVRALRVLGYALCMQGRYGDVIRAHARALKFESMMGTRLPASLLDRSEQMTGVELRAAICSYHTTEDGTSLASLLAVLGADESDLRVIEEDAKTGGDGRGQAGNESNVSRVTGSWVWSTWELAERGGFQSGGGEEAAKGIEACEGVGNGKERATSSEGGPQVGPVAAQVCAQDVEEGGEKGEEGEEEEEEVVVLGEWSQEEEKECHREACDDTGEPEPSRARPGSFSEAAPGRGGRQTSSLSLAAGSSNASTTVWHGRRAGATDGLQVALPRNGGAARSSLVVGPLESDKRSGGGRGALPSPRGALPSPSPSLQSLASPRRVEDDLTTADTIVWDGVLEIARECSASPAHPRRCEYCANDMSRAAHHHPARGSSQNMNHGYRRPPPPPPPCASSAVQSAAACQLPGEGMFRSKHAIL